MQLLAMTLVNSPPFTISVANPTPSGWIGVPSPQTAFGYDPLTINRPAHPAEWPAAEATNYYYIDPDHPSATNSSNTFGYPNRPRVSIPETTYAAGSYVEVHGTHGGFSGGNQLNMIFNGTSANPCWFVGDPSDLPLFTGRVDVSAGSQHVIFEDLRWDMSGQSVSPWQTRGNCHYITVRKCEAFGQNNVDRGPGSAFSVGGSASDGRNSHIVLYQLDVHDLGQTDGLIQSDYMGATAGAFVDQVWVLDCDIHRVGGDSVRPGTNMGTLLNPASDRATYIYIAGNRFSANGENCIDIKHSEHVIISQNTFSDIRDSVSSSGGLVVAHEKMSQCWVLFNEFYDGGIGVNNTDEATTFVVGNTFRNITSARSASNEAGYAFNNRGGQGAFVNNSVYACGGGCGIEASQTMEIAGNIFAARTTNAGSYGSYDLRATNSSGFQNSTSDYNLFEAKAVNNGQPSFDPNSVEALSMMSDPANGDFSLNAGSAALANGTRANIYSVFQSTYGLSIEFAIDGTARPASAGSWDIGAHQS